MSKRKSSSDNHKNVCVLCQRVIRKRAKVN